MDPPSRPPSRQAELPRLTGEPMAGEASRAGLGVRAQVLLVLSAVFLLAFPLLGLTAGELGRRTMERRRLRDVDQVAATLQAGLGSRPSRERFVLLADAALSADGPLVGVGLHRQGLAPWLRGRTDGVRLERALDARTTLRLWVRPRDEASAAQLQRFVSLYAAVTGGATLALLFLALTVLIVRPLQGVTEAASRLAAGRLEARAPVRGGREIARLAVAFNRMAEALDHEQRALRERVEQLERLTAALREARDQVARAARLASVGRIAAGLAHEVGNPLAGIVGMVELLRSGEVPEAQRAEFLERIGREAERIHGILRELLDFARADQSEGQRPASADPAQVATEAVRLVAPQRKARKVAFEVRAEPASESLRVAMPPERLQQVLVNLLLNAVDALDGQGEVLVRLRPVADAEGRPGVCIEVEDDGPGFPEAMLEEAFEPFVTSKPPGEGTGLGLAVSRHLVEQFGGHVRAENRSEGGARVRLWLPAPKEPADEADGTPDQGS